MSKKKSVEKDELKDVAQLDVNHEASESEQEASDSSEKSGSDVGESVTNPENQVLDDALSKTGEFVIDDVNFVDTQMLGRLRQTNLTLSEVYREAQIFSSQALDVDALLSSGEPILVHNIVEILRTLNIWCVSSLSGLGSSEQKTREVTERYVLHCLRHGLVSGVELVEAYGSEFSKVLADERDGIALFGDKLRSALVNKISQGGEDASTCQQALTRLCSYLDSKVVGRMLYDPSPLIRVSVIRALMMRSSLDMNDLSMALILLKDRDELVNISLMRLFAKFVSCPELVVPQLLALWGTASDNLKSEIQDVFRSYGNEAISSVMQSLEDTRDDIYAAACRMIALVPQRYTDVLLSMMSSHRTRDHVRTRIIEILKGHKDELRREEIGKALMAFLHPAQDEYPEWIASEPRQMFLEPATDNADIYASLLDDKAIASFSKTCDDVMLGRLLNDASEMAQINALRIIQHRGNVPQSSEAHVRVWLKSSSHALAAAALEAFLSYEKNIDNAVSVVMDAFRHGESEEVRQHLMGVIQNHQAFIDGVIRAFYQTPRRCAGFVMMFLKMNPNAQTLSGILQGLGREQSAACIAETMMCLYQSKLKFDNRSIRSILLQHLNDPVSVGQHGFQSRLFAIKLLGRFLREDETPDKSTISALQAFYKDSRHTELKMTVKNLLQKLGEDLFDLNSEDDDFDDLEDEEEEF